MRDLILFQSTITDCARCPRLTTDRQEIGKEKVRRFKDWEYWGRPVPSFGDPQARVDVFDLSPAAHGGNRTGRVFMGDRSGDWLSETLHAHGFANQRTSVHRGDDLTLQTCSVAAAVLLGRLKKAASSVLAIFPCSRTGSTLRAQKKAVVLLDGLF